MRLRDTDLRDLALPKYRGFLILDVSELSSSASIRDNGFTICPIMRMID